MSELAAIVEELKDIHSENAWHGPSLHDALEGVTAEQAARKPIGNAHSIWEIVLHITGWENVFRRRLEGDGKAKEPEAGDFPPVKEPHERAWRDTLAGLETEHQQLLKVITGLSEDQLGANIAHKDYSVRYLLHGIIRHHVYHAGQISLLKKATAKS